ncbi:MAG: hypothetical protein ACYDAG_03785 [Chloroflexota bacterium]
MSALARLLKTARRGTGRPSAGFGARQQDGGRKRLVLIATLPAADPRQAQAAVEAGADALEVPLADLSEAALEGARKVAEAVSVPVGVSLSGRVDAGFDVKSLEGKGLDYLKVEAGDVPASVFLSEELAIVLELKDSFSDTMLKMLNFLPARAVQVDSPETVEGLTIKELMEKRVDRELIGKPLLIKVGASVKPAGAQLLALISPNGLVVPASEAAAWSAAIADMKEPSEDEDEASGPISLRAPVATNAG